MDAEQIVWQGRSSQILNLPVYLGAGVAAGALLGGAALSQSLAPPFLAVGLAAAALLPLALGLVRWLQVRCRVYTLTTERFRLRQGILTRHTEEVELYRVKDYTLIEPFWLRLFGLGNLILTTNDDSTPQLILRAVANSEKLRDLLRHHVETCRERKRVRVTEFEG